jgi:hypothetical protein
VGVHGSLRIGTEETMRRKEPRNAKIRGEKTSSAVRNHVQRESEK